MKEIIHSEKAPAAIGPYSHAVKSGNFIFLSGQLPIDYMTGEFASQTIEGQTRQALSNARYILEAAGVTLEDVVKTTVLLTDLNNFAAMNAVYQEFFTDTFPSRTAYQVSKLPKGALIEIEMIAEAKDAK